MRGAASAFLATALLLHMTLASVFMNPSPAYALTLEQAEAAAGRISAGEHHSLAVTPGGSVSAWGSNDGDQADVPSGLADVVAVSAGFLHSLALMSDGTAVGWGGGTFNWSFVPPGLDDAVAISAGGEHSLILRSDGTVVATGSNSWQQCDVPPGEAGFSAVSAGDYHSLALKSDRTVVAWGRNLENQCNVPSGNDFVAVAGGGLHSLALRDDGTVVAWGRNAEGQCSVPSGLNNVVAIAAGMRHSLALRSDGTVVAWGGATKYGVDGSVSVPSGLTDVVAIDAGGYHSLALLSGGTVVGWGDNDSGQCFGVVSVEPAPYSRNVPPDAVFSVSFSTNALAGPEYSRIALRDSGGSAVAITKALSGDVLTVTPTAPLNTDTSYTLVIPAGSLQDAYGSANPTYSFDYFTPDTLPPVIVSVDLPDADGDPGSQRVRVHFNEGVYPGESFGGIVLRDAEGGVVDTSVTIGGYRQRVLTVTPETVLDLQESFVLTIPAGAVSDESGNTLAATAEISFGGAEVDVQHDAAGVVFDRWVTGYSTAYSGGGYVYGRWTGTELSARFTGSKIRWVGPKQPVYGMADVYIDDVLVAENVDCYAPAAEATLDALIWESGTLSDGAHTITLRLKGNRNASSTGNTVVLDRFEVDGAAPQGGGTRIDDAAATPGYTGSWISAINPTYYDKTYSYSRWAGHVFSVTFNGTKVAWLGPMTPFYGKAEIWLDGSYVTTVDAYSATQGWRERIWESQTLSPGTHTLEIRPTGEKNPASTSANIVVDAIDVTE